MVAGQLDLEIDAAAGFFPRDGEDVLWLRNDAFVEREAIGEVFQVRRACHHHSLGRATIGEGNGDFLGDLAGGGGEAAGREGEAGRGREGFMLSLPPGVKSPLAAAISPTRGRRMGAPPRLVLTVAQRFCFLDITARRSLSLPLVGRVGEGSL